MVYFVISYKILSQLFVSAWIFRLQNLCHLIYLFQYNELNLRIHIVDFKVHYRINPVSYNGKKKLLCWNAGVESDWYFMICPDS
jgi:hypothetical protein